MAQDNNIHVNVYDNKCNNRTVSINSNKYLQVASKVIDRLSVSENDENPSLLELTHQYLELNEQNRRRRNFESRINTNIFPMRPIIIIPKTIMTPELEAKDYNYYSSLGHNANIVEIIRDIITHDTSVLPVKFVPGNRLRTILWGNPEIECLVIFRKNKRNLSTVILSPTKEQPQVLELVSNWLKKFVKMGVLQNRYNFIDPRVVNCDAMDNFPDVKQKYNHIYMYMILFNYLKDERHNIGSREFIYDNNKERLISDLQDFTKELYNRYYRIVLRNLNDRKKDEFNYNFKLFYNAYENQNQVEWLGQEQLGSPRRVANPVFNGIQELIDNLPRFDIDI